MYTSVSNIVTLGLLVSAPLTSAYVIPGKAAELDKKDIVSKLQHAILQHAC